ncbi:hypothetical protein DFQ10_101881 [Winogradskyella eximia]|jgi:hypothetical protein|uniref:Uncharacterized protein n=1 Tax=Winogradskyella eximia TaxID=262006 RepID=A0A3D9HCB0_9FLAO|nr:hypothetical protein DFQ10_101881 [Winogradskyella eximia]
MVVNKTKLLAAIFIIVGSVLLFINDLKFNPLILIFKTIGFGLFIYVLVKEKK